MHPPAPHSTLDVHNNRFADEVAAAAVAAVVVVVAAADCNASQGFATAWAAQQTAAIGHTMKVQAAGP